MNATRIFEILRLAPARFALLVLTPLVLAGCGGGGGDMFAAGGIVGTGDAGFVSIGAITALGAGSLTVNGTTFGTGGATVKVNGQPATEAALRVGMVVTVQAHGLADGSLAAMSIDYHAEVQGVVSGVDTAGGIFTVLGQLVHTDKATVFAGGTFDTLLNQYVEVSGFRSSPGTLLATRVEIHPVLTPGASLEVTGVVSALDTAARTFSIGAQLVDYANIAAAFVPATLTNGVLADVHGTTVAASNRLIANSIDIVPTTVPAPEASRVEIEGLITDFVSIATFKVNGQAVDGSAATVEGGTPTMLGNGIKVEVEGKLTLGTVVASKISIEEDADVVLDGMADAVDVAAASVTVAGQQILTTSTTQFEDKSAAAARNFSLDAIRVGDHLSVRATHSAKKLVAKRVERLDGAAPSTTAEGIISEYVSIASFKVGGRKVNANSAKFENGVAADLADGRRVEVQGTLSGDVLMASRVEFKSGEVPPGVVDIKGTISAYVSKASFKVAGQAVDATGATFDGGTAADLADGRVVEVVGTIVNGILIATKVSIDAPSAPTLEIEGTITDFVTPANFKVAGQAVDASSATVKNGKAADLANGRKVEAKGPVVAGVLKATTVELKDTSEQEDAEAHGTITNFVSVANFQVAGRTIDASGATFEDGTAAKLANGVRVEVEGKLVGPILVAKKVSFE